MITALGSACKFLNGGTPSKAVSSYFEGDIPWITSADIVGPIAGTARSFITEEAIQKSATNKVTAGSVLLVTRTAVGKVAIAGTDLCFSQDITALIPDRTKLDVGYLVQYLRTKQTHFERRARGATIKGITRDVVADLPIPFPPLPEQRRIAAILDQADALRAKRRESLVQLDSLTQSIFIEMFGDSATNPKGWVVNPLSNFILTVTNGLTRRRSESDEGTDIVLRLRDIRSGWIDFSDVNRITLEPSETKRFSVSSGDLLFIRVNGNPDYVGRCAIFKGHSEPVFFNDHIMRVKVDPTKIHSVFLAFLLNSNHGKNEIAKHRKTSAGQHTINQDGLGKIQVPTPPVALQAEFVRRLENMGRQKNTFRESLAELDSLFASLQHRAFRGEL